MEVEYSLTYEDLQAFERNQRKQLGRLGPSLGLREWAWLVVLAAVIIAGAVAALIVTEPEGGPHEPATFIVGGLAAGAWSIVVVLTMSRRRLRLIRRLYEHGPSQWLLAHRRFIIGPEGFAVIGPSHRGQLAWPLLWKIAVTGQHAFFYTSLTQAYIVPRRAFPDPQSFDEFVDLARRYRDAPAPPAAPRPTGITTGMPAPTDVFRPDPP
jgi:hypothetical protein